MNNAKNRKQFQIINHRKQELKRIDLGVLERIMIVMYEAGKINKTDLSHNSKMSYDKCVKYLNCLDMLEIVQCQKENASYLYNLTSYGIRMCQKFESNSIYETESFTSSKILV